MFTALDLGRGERVSMVRRHLIESRRLHLRLAIKSDGSHTCSSHNRSGLSGACATTKHQRRALRVLSGAQEAARPNSCNLALRARLRLLKSGRSGSERPSLIWRNGISLSSTAQMSDTRVFPGSQYCPAWYLYGQLARRAQDYFFPPKSVRKEKMLDCWLKSDCGAFSRA